jgi:Domain of unknown function (DUF397)
MQWKKSSYSGQGNCVEVAMVPEGIAVRDSKNPDGPVLRFGTETWQAFIAGIKADRQG